MYIERVAQDIIMKLLQSNKIVMLLGARQVGKTTLVEHVTKGKNTDVFNLDLEIDKARLQAIAALSPQDAMKSIGSPELIIIDEAQLVPSVGRIVKGWYDSKVKTKIILLGSSSLNLLNQSAESLTGRNVKLYLPPLLFSEIMAMKHWNDIPIDIKSFQSKFKKQLESLVGEQLIFGSYPESVVTTNKSQYLRNLTSDYLLKDVFQSNLVRSIDVVKRLLLLLAMQIGSEVSVNELANNLQIARATVERYISFLEQSYVIFRLPAFSSNLRKEIVKNHKIFFWDCGVRNALLNDFSFINYRADKGALWENWIIAEFAKRNVLDGNVANLYFWRTRSGSEIDLVIKKGQLLLAYEIKWTKKSTSTKAFTDRYNTPVTTITKDNFLQYF